MSPYKQPMCFSTTLPLVCFPIKWEANSLFMFFCHRLLSPDWRISHLDLINCSLKYSSSWKCNLNSLLLSQPILLGWLLGWHLDNLMTSHLCYSLRRDIDFFPPGSWLMMLVIIFDDRFFYLFFFPHLIICAWFQIVYYNLCIHNSDFFHTFIVIEPFS